MYVCVYTCVRVYAHAQTLVITINKSHEFKKVRVRKASWEEMEVGN